MRPQAELKRLLGFPLLVSLLIPVSMSATAHVDTRRILNQEPGLRPAAAIEIAGVITRDWQLLTGASFVTGPPNGQPNGIADAPLRSYPTHGLSYGILTTGDVQLADDDNDSGDAGIDNSGHNQRGDGDFDVSTLRIDLHVPHSQMNCLALDFQILTEEYPEHLGGLDGFVAELDESTWTTSDSRIEAPDNFASSVDSGRHSYVPWEAEGTTYDGATTLLRARTPISPGEHSVYLSVFDIGDRDRDTAVFLDNLVVGNVDPSECRKGSSVLRYLAMGDSYASGEGDKSMETTFSQEPPVKCHRSGVAFTISFPDASNSFGGGPVLVACSGAKVRAFYFSQYGNQPAQLDQVSGAHDFIIVMVGGNDVRFGPIMADCVRNIACYRRHHDLSHRMERLESRLSNLYRRIQTRAPLAHIVVVGYPHIVPNSNDVSTCKEKPLLPRGALSARERDWLRGNAFLLNQTIRNAVRDAATLLERRGSFTFINTLNAFQGHLICQGAPSKRMVTGILPGVREGRIDFSRSFHPNRKGHDQLTSLLLLSKLPQSMQ